MVDDETQTLEEGKRDPEILIRVMITKSGRAAKLQKRLPIPFEIVFNSDNELVFSLRSKRRFTKAHLEAARWVMRTSFEPQSVLHQFPVTDIPAPPSTVVHQFRHQFLFARIRTT